MKKSHIAWIAVPFLAVGFLINSSINYVISPNSFGRKEIVRVEGNVSLNPQTTNHIVYTVTDHSKKETEKEGSAREQRMRVYSLRGKLENEFIDYNNDDRIGNCTGDRYVDRDTITGKLTAYALGWINPSGRRKICTLPRNGGNEISVALGEFAKGKCEEGTREFLTYKQAMQEQILTRPPKQ